MEETKEKITQVKDTWEYKDRSYYLNKYSMKKNTL